MSIYFSTISRTVGNRARVIVPNPDRIVINIDLSVPKSLSSEYLYMMGSEDISRYENLSDQNLMIVEHADHPIPPELFSVNNLNMVIVKDPTEAEAIKDDILVLFDEQSKISNFAYSLMDVCCYTSNIQKVLDTGYSFLNNPLLLVDTSLCLVASAGAYSGIDDETLSYCLQNNRLPESFLKDMVNETVQRSDPDFPDVLLLEGNDGTGSGSPIYSVRVTRDGQLLGYLKLFEYNHPMTAMEKNCLIILAGFLALSLVDSLPRLPNVKVQIEDFMTNIFSKELSSAEAIENRAALYHLNTGKPMKVLSIEYDRMTTSIDQLYFFKRQFQSLFNTSMVTFYNQMIVVIANEDALEGNLDEFTGILKGHHMTAGVSMKFSAFADLYKYYSQSLACLEMKKYFSLQDAIIDYSEWNLVHMFLNFQDYCSLEELIPEDVRILQEIDHAKGSDLTGTLFSFVHNRQDITNSAAEMHLHYNTMKYRINRIQELTGISFDDPHVMYRIIIAEKVMSIMRKEPPNFM